jgi:NAD(P)-dependent dehydrogenase (short-subunit alcohol dehydrogenase family)
MKEPKRRRSIAVRETFVEIKTHETRQSFLAASIAFLAADTASFITGQTLFVDGGASLGTL